MAFLEKMPIATIADVYARFRVALPGNHNAVIKWLVIAFTTAALFVSWGSTIDKIPRDGIVTYDSWDNLTLAYNLSHHGTISIATSDVHPRPTSRREPLPVAFLALNIASVEAIYGKMPLEAYGQGLGTGRLKTSNVFWAGLLALAVFSSIVRLSGSFVLAGVGTVLANTTVTKYFGSLLTEPHAAALLTVACYLSVVALSRRGPLYFGLAGAVFGLLALTKAAVFNLVIVLALLLVGWSLWQIRWPAGTRYVRIPGVIAFVLCFALTTGPWMLRNYVLLDYMGIRDSSAAVVLMVRAAKNRMSPTEYLGSFWVWAPNGVLKKLMSSLLGFSEVDLNRGGRLQRLSRSPKSEFFASDIEAGHSGRPEKAVSFFGLARAEKTKAKRELLAEGYSLLAAENELEKRAMAEMLGNPLRHMVMTLPFLWRGAGVTFPILVFVVCFGVKRRRPELVVYVMPALVLIAFYALLTHFIARYGDPMVPVSIVGGLVVSYAVVQHLMRRVARLLGCARHPGTRGAA